jgi:hypothetical protein
MTLMQNPSQPNSVNAIQSPLGDHTDVVDLLLENEIF